MSSDFEKPVASRQGRMIGASAQMQRVYSLIHQASAYEYPVLITGEKGTGKRLAAETIHSLSHRKEKAFVVVDSSKLAPTLADSELFGYEKGAFAGASQTQWGLLAFAREGTILLEEVGDLPLRVQSKLVQILHEKEFRPIGSNQALPFNARVLATTSRNLRSDVERGNVREDFFFRLSAMQISLAPLRERREDIPLLVDYFLEKSETAGPQKTQVSSAAMGCLCEHDWPGNVRELETAIARAISLRSGTVIEVADIPLRSETPAHRRWADNVTSYLDGRERHAIMEALRESQGDKSGAAKLLGIEESALHKRLQYYNL